MLKQNKTGQNKTKLPQRKLQNKMILLMNTANYLRKK